MAAALDHVLCLGGPAGAGKTTVATRLARRHGLRWYGADTRTWAHRDRAIAQGVAPARRWEELSPRARWEAPPDDLLAMSLHVERGRMVCDDLARLPIAPLVVAEGTVLPAWAVSGGVVDRSRALWLLPTAEFHARKRSRLPPGPAALSLLLAQRIEREAREHDVPTFRVDGSLGIEETVAAVEELLAPALAAGPRATTPEERQALLREANEAIVAQVRGYFARPWADGDAETVVREFVCECADPRCAELVAAAVGSAARAPVFSQGHAPTRT